jgi:hypothetical protein
MAEAAVHGVEYPHTRRVSTTTPVAQITSSSSSSKLMKKVPAKADNEVQIKPKSVPTAPQVSTAPQFSLANWVEEDMAVEFENTLQVFKLIDELEKQEVGDNFLFFKNVSGRDFHLVEEQRSLKGRRLKLCHISEIKLLIVQIPSGAHEGSIDAFDRVLVRKLIAMGVTDFEFRGIRNTEFKWQSGTGPVSREPDASYRNALFNPALRVPHFVVEVADSQSLPSVHTIADLWISRGDVLLVLTINIDRRNQTLLSEKWIPDTDITTEGRVRRRAQQSGGPTLVNLRNLEVTKDVPFILDFERVVGRSHHPPREMATIVFSQRDILFLSEIILEEMHLMNSLEIPQQA